jgi:hypothetical protein
MDEDVAGVQTLGTQHRYATCIECGQVFRTDSPVQTILDDDHYSELSEICPACDALDRQGETVNPDYSDDY